MFREDDLPLQAGELPLSLEGAADNLGCSGEYMLDAHRRQEMGQYSPPMCPRKCAPVPWRFFSVPVGVA